MNQTQKVALILGTGGLGSIILLNLLRLGIKKVFIIDYDVVDVHNLNRQLMFTLEDIGKPKVEAAKKNSQYFNVGGTEVQEYNIDAVKNWKFIVSLAAQSNVIFNCIDHGDYWDAAVQSLCLSLSIPHLIGGTFAQSFMAEIYFGAPCYACLDEMLKPEYVQQLLPNLIQNLDSLDFLPKNNKPVGQSHVALCSTCGNMVTQLFLNFVNEQDNSKQTKKILFYMTTFEVVSFVLECNPKCLLCSKPEPPKTEEEQIKQIQQDQPILTAKQDIQIQDEPISDKLQSEENI